MIDREAEKYSDWLLLKNHLNEVFQEPDEKAILILCSMYVSHFYLAEKPVWGFLLGGSSGGKSSIGIRALEHLAGVQTVTELTPATFLSAYGDDNGLLHRLTKKSKGNGIIVFSDFTPLLNDRPEIRAKVVGILRRLYDGSYEKDVGNRKSQLQWKGKLTCIAACTPVLERYWSIHRSLGERFLTLRWKSPTDMQGFIEKSTSHIGREQWVDDTFKELVRRFVEQDNPHEVDAGAIRSVIKKISPLAMLVAKMRVEIDREQVGSRRKVVDVGMPEAPGRLMKSLINLVRASASLFRRDEPNQFDIDLARRIAFDSLPSKRAKIVREVMKFPKMATSAADIRKATGLPNAAFKPVLEDLSYAEVLKVTKDEGEVFIEPTESFIDLWNSATG